MSPIVVPWEFPLVMLAIVILCLVCVIMGYAVVIPARIKHFNAKFMEQFTEEHQKAFPNTKPAPGGFPDAGDGRYSQKLEYKSWVEFNNAMRVH